MSDNTNKGELLQKIERLQQERDDAISDLDESMAKDGRVIASLVNALNNYENRVLKLIGNDTAAKILFRSERLIGEQMHSIDKLNEAVSELQQECNELAATVGAMANKLKEVNGLVNTDAGSAIQWILDNHAEVSQLALATPQQHLRDVRAEAGRAGYLKGADDWKSFDQVFDSEIKSSADKYAESVKAGEK